MLRKLTIIAEVKKIKLKLKKKTETIEKKIVFVCRLFFNKSYWIEEEEEGKTVDKYRNTI